MKNIIICLNCEKKGHCQKNCLNPINSYGVIIFKKQRNNIKYLLIQRKHSHSLIELMNCKFMNELFIFNNFHNMKKMSDINYYINFHILIKLIKNLPFNERILILNHSYDEIWKYVWNNNGFNENYKNIFTYIKFNYFEYLFNLSIIGSARHTQYWEFPKGKKNYQENYKDCAIRECFEETTLSKNDYYIYPNLKLFQDKYTGMNGKIYCNNFYIGELLNSHKLIYNKPNNYIQNCEVKKIGWFTYDKLIDKIDKNHIDIITHVNELLTSWKGI